MDPITLEDILKLLMAVAVGGLIGAEREYHHKAAGFRTIIFICLGSTLFTMISMKLGGASDPVRIAAQIVTGIGFIGAGVIMRESGRIFGITTAAIIWLVAALGMAIGGGKLVFATTASLLAILVAWVFPVFEHWIDNVHHIATYEITCPNLPGEFEDFKNLFREAGLRILNTQRTRFGGDMTITFEVLGRPKAHEAITQELLDDPDITEFKKER